MRNLVVLLLIMLILTLPCVSSAMNVQGQVHRDRYTFILNEKGSEALMSLNNRMAAFYRSSDANNKAARYAISQSGYDGLGVAPAPLGISQSLTVRDDGKPVKALTCVMSTVAISTITTDELWCKDEVGAEYIGFNAWPHHDIVQRACRVDVDDCPVYLSLQGDDPTVRDDSAAFTPLHPPKPVVSHQPQMKKPDPAIIALLKAQGCKIINRYNKKDVPKCGSVLDVTGGGVFESSPVTPYTVDYAEAGTGWRVQEPATLTYSGKTLVKFGISDDAIDTVNPASNKPQVSEQKNGTWNVLRNASRIEFSSKNASCRQLLLTCENRAFTVAVGQDNDWSSSGNAMSQLTLRVGAKEYPAGEALFDALKSSSGEELNVLVMGNTSAADKFSTAGLSGLIGKQSWDDCLYPERTTGPSS
ncbi:hypothetical protein [Atlantibacter hermannii]|uniref:hypothetical protein n=1 Tax=Atlantibacter hermannii TaxID=565 RepID=UPI00289F9872|nr:hypothetical protein [Atlantibacter hermannii]